MFPQPIDSQQPVFPNQYSSQVVPVLSADDLDAYTLIVKTSFISQDCSFMAITQGMAQMHSLERTTATAITEGTWGFEHTKACFRDEIIPFIKNLKDIFNNFNQYLVEELADVQKVFYQMEQAVEQHRLESRTFEVKMNQVLSENERLLAQAIDKDIVKTVVNLSVNANGENIHTLNPRNFSTRKQCLNQNAPSFTQLFELSELKAQSQAKDTVIVKLKEQIKSLKGNVEDSSVKMDMDEIETLNIELEHRVTKLVTENEILNRPIYNLWTRLKPKRVQTKEQCDELIPKQVLALGVRLSTSASGSQPSGNTKNDRILQTPSSNSKNKVEAHPRNVKSSLNKKNGTVNVHGSAVVQNLKKQDNSDYVCIHRDDCMPSDNLCVSNAVNVVKSRAKSKKNKSKKDIWKPTGKVSKSSSGNLIPVARKAHDGRSITASPISNNSVIHNLLKWLFATYVLHSQSQKVGGFIDGISRKPYTLTLGNMMASLSYLHGLVRGLPKLKFEKDHLCSACALGKSSKKPNKPKSEDTNQKKLNLLHMDLCGPMQCLRSKDEAPAFIINFLKMIQVRLKETVRRIRTDNGTEFVNQTLREYYEKVGISHETSVARSPQQNGVVERQISLNVDLYAPEVIAPIPETVAPEHAVSTGSPSSTTVDQDGPSPSTSHTTQGTQTPILSHDVKKIIMILKLQHMVMIPYFVFQFKFPSDQSSSDVIHTIVHPDHQVSEHTSKWTKDHPLEE
ncbi:retrovirus-related pol polyprotein from transposon TNT 1-94 [Tanacetum coccineum]